MACLASNTNNNNDNPDSPTNTNMVNMPRFQGPWFKNIVSLQQAKPSASGSVAPPDTDDDTSPLHQKQDAGLAARDE
jgi:hypothetical protein